MSTPKHIVFYDGHCLLCNGAIKYLLKNDKKKRLKVAPLQSDVAEHYLQELHKPWPDSIILYSKGKIYLKSTAVLLAMIKLNALHWPLGLLLIIPNFIRNWVYDWVARNRYGWFGKSDACLFPGAYTDQILKKAP